MDTSKITDVLIFKGGYYWLTINGENFPTPDEDGYFETETYLIVPKDDWKKYGIDRNGFEFASDAYAYIASLSPMREPRKNGVHLIMTDEVYDKEEERLKEMGEV